MSILKAKEMNELNKKRVTGTEYKLMIARGEVNCGEWEAG